MAQGEFGSENDLAPDIYFIDSHCHVQEPEFFPRPEEALAEARRAKVRKIVCIGTDAKTSQMAYEFAKKQQEVFWTYGVHPETLVNTPKKQILAEIEAFDKRMSEGQEREGLVAIGEIGLDYHYKPFERMQQVEILEAQLELAIKYDLPVVFHIREAFEDFFPVVKNFPKVRGVVHSFADNKETLGKCLDRGFFIGVNGLATFATIPLAPLERVLLETDAPFLAPVPLRGRSNQPAFIPYIGEFLAKKCNLSVDKVARQTTKNAEELFGM